MPNFNNMGATNILSRLKHLNIRKRTSWSFNPHIELWEDQISTPEMENLSGVYQKIESIKKLGITHIIGGISTGGNDKIFCQSDGFDTFSRILDDIPSGDFLFLYSPHQFWSRIFPNFKWIPSWGEIYACFLSKPDWSVFQYSTSFDPAGRFFFIAQKTPRKKGLTSLTHLSGKTFHVFYYREGGDARLSRSNMALSAHLCLALTRIGAIVHAHDMNDTKALGQVKDDDILIGHVGQWVKTAYDRGLRNIILFNPANQWYPTRNNEYFEKNATIAEQIHLSKMVIAQSGAIWRLTAEVIDPEKWRWIDLGVDPQLFQFRKRKFNAQGKRKSLFFHLYDDNQKGADIANAIVKARPGYGFASIGSKLERASNLKLYPSMENSSRRFCKILNECDFILLPSKEDAQPGTYVEAASIGLIPVASYTSGYSISFPTLITPNEPDNWVKALDILQNLDTEVLLSGQEFFQYYLKTIHNWTEIENQILIYLRECL